MKREMRRDGSTYRGWGRRTRHGGVVCAQGVDCVSGARPGQGGFGLGVEMACGQGVWAGVVACDMGRWREWRGHKDEEGVTAVVKEMRD